MKKVFIACRRALAPLAFSMLALLVSGCATPALWKHTAAREWRPQPLADQFLLLTTTGRQDVVVVFRQFANVDCKIKFRVVAWNLRNASSELTVGPKALRQLTNACERVQPMPVFSQDALPSDATGAPLGYILQDESRDQFTVQLDGVPPVPFELPVSRERCRSGTRIALMPLAIATDAAIVFICTAGLAGAGGGGMAGGF